MIQRIQSVYLLVVAILMALIVPSTLAELSGKDVIYFYKACGVYTSAGEVVLSAFPVMLISIVVALLALVSIFLFKKRILQIRFCIFNAVLMVGFYAAFFFYYWMVKEKLQVDLHVKFMLGLPLIAFVLNWLAIRSIGADEALVRSLNRIR